MQKQFTYWIFIVAIFLFTLSPAFANAATTGKDNIQKAEPWIEQALQSAQQGNLDQAHQAFERFHSNWMKIEDSIKSDSTKAYKDIEDKMGMVEFGFSQNNRQSVVQALQELQSVNRNYIEGKYPSGDTSQSKQISLSEFIQLLQQTKEKANAQDHAGALQSIRQVRESWLSVEGVVVAQSSTVYNNAERDMVTVQAMLETNRYSDAVTLLDHMIQYLSPLAQKTGYTMWDAALIPIREGLEALLVIAALLAFVKKGTNGKGKGWIWSGVISGLGVSILLAILVKFVFSSGAFGNNNSLISGWSGVLAAAMLLYVSYWLHNQAHVRDWQAHIRNKSQAALHTGKLVSLGLLAFLAVFREGTETVLFIIGIVNQISLQHLILGLLIGFGVLILLAFLMLVAGVRLPLRPFFMVSSLIVFYLCLKFTGMGIHSLQLAGFLPSSTAPIPSVDWIALYPSWQSFVPQLLLLLLGISVWLWKRRTTSLQKQD
jgi:high-affinity iron transporter